MRCMSGRRRWNEGCPVTRLPGFPVKAFAGQLGNRATGQPFASMHPRMSTDVLGIGLTGKHLTDLERRILSENTPYAVVLFGRNIGAPREFVELVAEVK